MEFVRRDGYEVDNRYHGGPQGRRGGGRTSFQQESYFDRQGDVRLQGGASKGSDTARGTRHMPSHRGGRTQHNFAPRPQHEESHEYHGHHAAQRPNFGRVGVGAMAGNRPGEGFHEHRNRNGRGDQSETQNSPHGLPVGFSAMGRGRGMQGPMERSVGQEHTYRRERQQGNTNSHPLYSRGGYGYAANTRKPHIPTSHGSVPMHLKGLPSQSRSFQGFHERPFTPRDEDFKQPELGYPTVSVKVKEKTATPSEGTQIIPQVLKREPERLQQDDKVSESVGMTNGGKNVARECKTMVGQKPDKKPETVKKKEESTASGNGNVAATKASGARQGRNRNKKGKQGKPGKDEQPARTEEIDKKLKKCPSSSDQSKSKAKLNSRQTSKESKSFSETSRDGAKRKEVDTVVSPEEMESLKALEERLKEVKLFGTEKYESKGKVGAQVSKTRQKVMSKFGPLDSEQAKSLVEQLIDGTYDCMVCCERIKWAAAVWNCINCYHIFHLTCIKKWVDTSTAKGKDPDGWRCPACQNVSRTIPDKYKCFCGKVTNPEWKARDGITPHSCGSVCKKSRMVSHCSHMCTELCHPGPCPSCPVMISWHCPCGKKSYQIRCGKAVSRPCDNVCGKGLKCGRHQCQEKCHVGPCDQCTAILNLACFCGKEKMEETCGSGKLKELKGLSLSEEKGSFSCDKVCGRMLKCGIHTCAQSCHNGDCPECPLLPKNVTHCPCGKVKMETLIESGKERTSCADPIPFCGNTCQKILKCGTGGKPHYCKKSCHLDECGPCDGTSMISCRCGAAKKEVPCAGDVKDRGFQCGKICKKKRSCGRHRCNTKCCVDDAHLCLLVCGKKLQCGLHHCDELCHPGYCPRCWQTGFEERTCHCGKTIQEPPIPCGTPPPECHHPCNRSHDCEHPVQHNCHSHASCPPCAVLTTKSCMGEHETRKNVLCHIKDFSCGKKCGKPLPCGHNCDKSCHKGECITSSKCRQPCTAPRKSCGHSCMAPCHPNEECPPSPCNAQIPVQCPCGRRNGLASCKAENVAKDTFARFMSENMSEKMHVLQSGQLDLTVLKRSNKRLQCDEECALAERNRRLADAFNRECDDTWATPRVAYSYFLQQEGEANASFVKMVEEKMEELVTKIKKIDQSQLSHSFPPMSSTQRRIIHELAAHFGCDTQSYDQEPKRNTVVIASKESRVPPNKLSAQFHQQAPPQPMVLAGDKSLTFQSLRLETLEKRPKKPHGPDYFDDNYED